MTIRDIKLTQDFAYDYDHAPQQARKALDKLVRMILETGEFPRSMRVHSAKSQYNELLIGYVTRRREHWRVLMEADGDSGLVVMTRLLNHNDADKYISQYV